MSNMDIIIQNAVYILITVGVIVALTVYIMNSVATGKRRQIENIKSYLEVHERLFAEDSYLLKNEEAMKQGCFTRDTSDEEMENALSKCLGDTERLALIQSKGAISKELNAYMLGWFAKRIYPVLSGKETTERYWTLAVEFLRETKEQAEKLDGIEFEDFAKYMRSIC